MFPFGRLYLIRSFSASASENHKGQEGVAGGLGYFIRISFYCISTCICAFIFIFLLHLALKSCVMSLQSVALCIILAEGTTKLSTV